MNFRDSQEITDKPVAIEIKSSAAPLTDLVINEPFFNNRSDDFKEFRDEHVNIIKNNGANVMARVQDSVFMHQNKSFKTTLSETLASALKICCTQPRIVRCSFCLSPNICELVSVDDEGTCHFDAAVEQVHDERFFARVKLNAKTVGVKMKDLIKEDEEEEKLKCLQLPICSDCAATLKLHIKKIEMTEQQANGLQSPAIKLYDRLFAEVCLLRHLSEKYTLLSQRMRRDRDCEVEVCFDRTLESFRNQLAVCRALIKEMESFAEAAISFPMRRLYESIIIFMTACCDDVQVIVSRNTAEVDQFLALEAKVMSPVPDAPDSTTSITQLCSPVTPSPTHVATSTWKWVTSFFTGTTT